MNSKLGPSCGHQGTVQKLDDTNEDVAGAEGESPDLIYGPDFCQTYTGLDKNIQKRLAAIYEYQ